MVLRENFEWKRSASKDLLFIMLFAGLVLFLSVRFDFFEKFISSQIVTLERFEIDEVILLIAMLSFACAIFAWRRWMELNAEVSARMIFEKELQQSEEKYKILTEISQTGIYIHQDDRIVYANRRFAELHGYTVGELIGTNYFDLYHPGEIARAQEIKSKRLRAEDVPQYLETRRIRKDGGVFFSQTVSACIEYQGKPAIMGNVVDITERKRAERQRDKLIAELQNALAEVKTLRGFIPICSHCKKIRDDKGYWNQIEAYIHKHSGAEFSHSICPECAQKYYPDIDLDDA